MLIARLFSELEQNVIRYCHWKSNTALSQLMAAETDLDILVSDDDEEKFKDLIAMLGFTKVQSIQDKWYEGIRHYYAYDHVADKLVHIHLHTRLLVGHDLLKNYHFPVEKAFLDSAILVESVRVPCPELEYIVFILRMTLKRSFLSTCLSSPIRLAALLFGCGRWPLHGVDKRDFERLQRQVSRTAVRQTLRDCFCSVTPVQFDLLVESLGPTPRRYVPLGACWLAHRVLKRYRTGSSVAALLCGLRRKISVFVRTSMSRFGCGCGMKKKLPTGRIIALVGADGSGKSTQVTQLTSYFSAHFAVSAFRVGKPNKGIVWYTMLIPLAVATTCSVFPRSFYYALRYLLLARYRYRTCKEALNRKRHGHLVLLDRLPLPQIKTMDGPRISDTVSGRIITSFMARYEKKYYASMKCADEVVVLRVHPNVAIARRPEEDRSALLSRSGEIWNARWTCPRIHVLDASESTELVNRRLRKISWSSLHKSTVVAEMIGPAGAGKSSTARLLASDNYDVLTTLSYRNAPLRALSTLFSLTPRLVMCALQGTRCRPLLVAFNIEVVLALLRRHKTALWLPVRHLVLDVGPMQQIATLRCTYLRDLCRSPLLDAWISDLQRQAHAEIPMLFLFDASDDILFARINARKQEHRMTNKSKAVFRQFVLAYRSYFEQVAADARALRHTVIRVDTSAASLEQISQNVSQTFA